MITGAFCCGKTTLIDLLAERGFQTVPEIPRQYIERELAEGRTLDEIFESAADERVMKDWQLGRDVMDLDAALAEFAESRNIPIFGIANAQGFADALPGWHPKGLMPKCESVIVLGHPLLPHPLHMEARTYIVNRSWFDTQRNVSRQIATWKGELFGLLDDCGLGVASFGVFRYTTQPTFSYRLAQVEAGVGVYGRAGACIHPDYGCYYRVGVLLTEAELTPTSKDHLDGFKPCKGCSVCGQACPISAIDVSKEPGAGYDRERCARFIYTMSERSGTQAYICAQCYSLCPWSMERKGNLA